MKCLTAVTIAAFVLSCSTAIAKQPNRYKKLERSCSQGNPRGCVRYAIFVKHLSGWQINWMWRIPSCESGWNPYAHNPSGSSGLYQFQPSTWYGTPYGRQSIWSAKYQALAAAWMLLQGRSGEWVCQ